MRLFRRVDGRYYVLCQPTYDLFGDRVVITYHGNRTSKLGGVKTYYSPTSDAELHLERSIAQNRLAHGYQEVIEQSLIERVG